MIKEFSGFGATREWVCRLVRKSMALACKSGKSQEYKGLGLVHSKWTGWERSFLATDLGQCVLGWALTDLGVEGRTVQRFFDSSKALDQDSEIIMAMRLCHLTTQL